METYQHKWFWQKCLETWSRWCLKLEPRPTLQPLWAEGSTENSNTQVQRLFIKIVCVENRNYLEQLYGRQLKKKSWLCHKRWPLQYQTTTMGTTLRRCHLTIYYLAESRGAGADVGEVELLLCFQDKWSQFLWETKRNIRGLREQQASQCLRQRRSWQKYLQYSHMFSCQQDWPIRFFANTTGKHNIRNTWSVCVEKCNSSVIWLQLMVAVFSLHNLGKKLIMTKFGDIAQPLHCESSTLAGHIPAGDYFRP